MVQTSSNRRLGTVLRSSSLYPIAKTVYRNTFNRTYLSQSKRMVEFFSAWIKPGDLVFDIGANVGDFTSAFLKLGANVCAVEAHPFCIHELQSLYQHNRRFTLIAKALGSEAGRGTLYLGGQGMHNVSTLSREWKDAALKIPGLNRAGWNETVEVEVTTLDQLITKYGVPTFCKIDVEGSEYQVLKRLNQPIPCLSFEFVSWQIEPTFHCVEQLASLGNYQFNLTIKKTSKDNDVGELEFKAWRSKAEIINFLNTVLAQQNQGVETVGDLYARWLPNS